MVILISYALVVIGVVVCNVVIGEFVVYSVVDGVVVIHKHLLIY